MEGLLITLLKLIAPWDNTFPTPKSANRAKQLCISLLVTMGKKLISRSLMASGRDQGNWSADYRLFSRCVWSSAALFRPILQEAAATVNEDIIAVGFDDTLVKKTGKRIKGTSWQRDSLSPHFCNNFVWGMRFLQASILLPLYTRKVARPCRGIPVQFTQLPHFKKPRKKASEEDWSRYKTLKAKHNSSTEFVKQLRFLRNELTQLGYKSKKLLAVVDASYVNRTCLLSEIPGTDIVGRVRKTARFYFKSEVKKGKRFYDPESFTAKELKDEKKRPLNITSIHYGAEFREVKYKEYEEIYWKWGTKKKPLRLIVVFPTPYRRTMQSRMSYRDPAYLLTTNFDLPAQTLIQKYMDRWQIEVNFKEEKSYMTLGKQQAWSEKAIPKTPAFVAACYAALMLASVLHFSDSRSHESFDLLPKWRKKEDRRPSFLDLVSVLRKEVADKPIELDTGPPLNIEKTALISKAVA